MAELLDRIVKNDLCHGCGACVAAVGDKSLAMRMGDEGYLRPARIGAGRTDEDTVVRDVCSGYAIHQDRQDRCYNPVWGPLVTVQTGYAIDPEVRYRGSSGGVISALALHLIETGQVDFVVQTRASQDDPTGNITDTSTDREGVLGAAGSRYAPSAPLADLGRYLSSGLRFAFVGRPCDVAALRRMARVDPRIDAQVPIMLSFFCAGVPSRKGALGVLKALGVEYEDVREFAYRGRGWPGLARAVRHDGTEESMDYNSSWGTILNRHLQFRCKICPDGTGEFADVVCADAWHGKDGYPDFTEAEGRSLVVARTAAGRSLLDGALEVGRIGLKDIDVSEIRSMQPYQYDRKRAVLARLTALLLKARSVPRFQGLSLIGLTVRSSPLWLLRNCVGTYRRIARTGPL